MTFMHLLYLLAHSPNQCIAITNHPKAVVYGGNCLQAFLVYLAHPLTVGWQYLQPVTVVTG